MIRHPRSASLTRAGLFLAALTIVSTAWSQDLVTVQLVSGRSFTAWIDERTDESTLWLRFQSRHTDIRRPIAWQRVESAEYRGEALSAEQLKQLAPSIKSAAADVPPQELGPEEIEPRETNEPTRQATVHNTLAVRAMTVDAQLGNWDEDQEPDGIVVWVSPQDAYGRLMQVSGHAEVRLLAPLQRRFHEAPSSRGASLEQIASWTRNLQPGAVGDDGAQMLLPFQAVDPEFCERVGNFGMVQVRLVVPGHGVLERTVHLVRIRTFSPLRDRFGEVEVR